MGVGPGSPFRQLLRGFVVLFGVLGLLALALVGIQLASFQKQGDAPFAAARQFCEAVVQRQSDRPAVYGSVRECSVDGRDVWGSFGADHAAYTVTVVLNDGQHTGDIYLRLDSPFRGRSDALNPATWVVESVDPQLHLDVP